MQSSISKDIGIDLHTAKINNILLKDYIDYSSWSNDQGKEYVHQCIASPIHVIPYLVLKQAQAQYQKGNSEWGFMELKNG